MSDELATIESRLLCRAVREACWYLGQDRFADGYRCLRFGLQRLCEERLGEPWEEDLAEEYRAAIFHYARLYPTPLPPACG